MKNKIRRVLFGSIIRELLLVNILSFALVATGILVVVSVIFSNRDTANNMLADSNSIYVEVTRYITHVNDNTNEYLKKLGNYYKFNIAVTDQNGNILLKSENVNTDKIELPRVAQILQRPAYDGTRDFYQLYDIRIDGQDGKLVVWKRPKLNQNMDWESFILLITILPVAAVAALIYILTRKKVKYIETICRGIKTIANGNLDYRIQSKGLDELALLTDEINNMSANLKYRIEEERKAERLKSELITNVSHDLKTPLTSLTAYLQLADDERTLLPERERYVKIAREKSSKLKKLIEDLFEYSKLESGGIRLNKSHVNLIEIIEQSIGELSIQANDRKIAFDKNFSSNSIVLNIDSDKMGRVFENIISNAVKYGIPGSTVNITVLEEDNTVLISFENKTDLLAEESTDKIADKVFERFYRGDKSRNSDDGGSGLGLAIAKSIIELHKGQIWVQNEDKIFMINLRLPKKCDG